MIKNYHTHTKRCHHALGEDEEYVLSAISKGYKTLGFSDHAPYIYPEGYVSNYKMTPDELSEYCDSLLFLKEKYKDKIEILIGLETEYYPDLWDKTLEFFRSYPIDYLILGQHFVGSEYDPMKKLLSGAPTGGEEKIKEYVDLCIKAIQTGVISYVAHPDIIRAEAYDREFYISEMERLVLAAKENDIPLEINLLGIRGKRHYPNEEFLALCKKHSPKMIIGVDAHEPGTFLDTEAEKIAYDLAKKYSLEIITDLKINPVICK